jgi:hypothetical protein
LGYILGDFFSQTHLVTLAADPNDALLAVSKIDKPLNCTFVHLRYLLFFVRTKNLECH